MKAVIWPVNVITAELRQGRNEAVDLWENSYTDGKKKVWEQTGLLVDERYG